MYIFFTLLGLDVFHSDLCDSCLSAYWQGYRIGNAETEDEESWYYWELVVVSRKIAIIIISVRMRI